MHSQNSQRGFPLTLAVFGFPYLGFRQAEQRKKQPNLTVFEEGEGGRVGCRQDYWKQHYVKERNVRVVGDDSAISDRKDLDVWRTPDNEVTLFSFFPFFPFDSGGR